MRVYLIPPVYPFRNKKSFLRRPSVKQIFELPILVIILSLASLAIAQAQHSNTSKVGGSSVADLEQLRTMAEKGDPDAQYRLAEKYRIGYPVEQDYAQALELYTRSAGQGHAASQFRLGELYEEGDILELDVGKAIESYNQAAEQGHAGAQYAEAEPLYQRSLAIWEKALGTERPEVATGLENYAALLREMGRAEVRVITRIHRLMATLDHPWSCRENMRPRSCRWRPAKAASTLSSGGG